MQQGAHGMKTFKQIVLSILWVAFALIVLAFASWFFATVITAAGLVERA